MRENGLQYGDWKGHQVKCVEEVLMSVRCTGRMEGLLLQFNVNIFRDPRWGRGQAASICEWLGYVISRC